MLTTAAGGAPMPMSGIKNPRSARLGIAWRTPAILEDQPRKSAWFRDSASPIGAGRMRTARPSAVNGQEANAGTSSTRELAAAGSRKKAKSALTDVCSLRGSA